MNKKYIMKVIIVSFFRPEWLTRLALQTGQSFHEGHTCQ
jgi:hypothetical protein